MRVFHIISGFENGGVEMLLERWIAAMPRDIEFHIVAHDVTVPACRDRLAALGAEIHLIPRRKRPFAHQRALRALFLQYRPEVVHVHTTEWGFLALQIAGRCAVPVRIQHSHAAWRCPVSPSLALRFRLGRRAATDYFACGEAAARTAFGERLLQEGGVVLLPNGIDVEKFRFDPVRRAAMRQELDLAEDALAIGMVARFSPQKNHGAALDIFECFFRRHPNAVLLLVGDGELRPEIEAAAAKRFPTGAVRFLGVREDVAPLYDAMDRFLLPSRFEGFPITLVEAQSAGLPAAVSDTVSPEVALTDLVRFASVEDGNAFCDALEHSPALPREAYAEAVLQAGFSLTDAAERLYQFYQSKK
ncbi:MAG: glycosyltransferase [Clostridia bacterium]|nr:glycosyltransferase [Clostridia bacterium]